MRLRYAAAMTSLRLSAFPPSVQLSWSSSFFEEEILFFDENNFNKK
jgi:hypothetical protein